MPAPRYSCNYAYTASGRGQPLAREGQLTGRRTAVTRCLRCRLRDARGDGRGLRGADADRAGELAAERGRHYLDVLTRLGRLDHPAVAQVDRDMRDVVRGGRIGVVKEQVTRLKLAHRHGGA